MSIKHLYEDERPTLLLDFANSKTLDPRITFERQSIGTYVDEAGIIRTAADNEARFDHDPVTGECLGLLIEESRTNFDDNSNAISSWSDHAGTNTKTSNAGIAPDGTNTATKVYPNAPNTSQRCIVLRNHSITAPAASTASIYAKADGKRYLQLFTFNDSYGAIFDLQDGTVVEPLPTGITGTIKDCGNGWYRCSTSETKTSSTHQSAFLLRDQPNSPICVTNGTDGVLVWGYQAEGGLFPTSYIPTSGSTVTRNDDEAEITGTNFSSWYNQSQGTIQVKYSSPTDTSSSYKRLVSIGDSSQNSMSAGTGFLYGSHSPSTSTRWMARNGTSIWYAGLASPASLSSAIAYQDDNLAISYDGATVLTNTSFTVSSMSTLPSRLDFFFNGTISRLAYYNTRLSDTTLEALTK